MKPAPTDRWPLLVDAPASEGSASVRASAVVASTVLFALSVVLPLGAIARTALVLAGLLAAVVAVLARRRRADTTEAGHVAFDGERIVRVVGDRALELGRLDAPLGVALLGSHDRTRAVLAFTAGASTRYVPVRVEESSTRSLRLLAAATLVADGDLGEPAAGQPSLDAASAGALVEALGRRDPGMLARLELTDAQGAPLRVDASRLEAAGRYVDLTAPFEWRPFMFHESLGAVTVLYRATWVRQGATELVLVAPLPTEEGAPISGRAAIQDAVPADVMAELRRGAMRDARLAQSLPESPPPRELRVSVDRPFVLAIRRLLDEAPLGARLVPTEPSRRSAERRAP